MRWAHEVLRDILLVAATLTLACIAWAAIEVKDAVHDMRMQLPVVYVDIIQQVTAAVKGAREESIDYRTTLDDISESYKGLLHAQIIETRKDLKQSIDTGIDKVAVTVKDSVEGFQITLSDESNRLIDTVQPLITEYAEVPGKLDKAMATMKPFWDPHSASSYPIQGLGLVGSWRATGAESNRSMKLLREALPHFIELSDKIAVNIDKTTGNVAEATKPRRFWLFRVVGRLF